MCPCRSFRGWSSIHLHRDSCTHWVGIPVMGWMTIYLIYCLLTMARTGMDPLLCHYCLMGVWRWTCMSIHLGVSIMGDPPMDGVFHGNSHSKRGASQTSGTFSGTLLDLTWLCTKASQTFSGIFSGTLLNLPWNPVELDLALHKSLPDLLRNLLRNPVEPDLPLHQSLPDLFRTSPEPCWTWPGSAPEPPRPSLEPSEPSPEFRRTWPCACTNAHRSFSGLKHPLDYALGEWFYDQSDGKLWPKWFPYLKKGWFGGTSILGHIHTAIQEKVFAGMPRFGPHANIYAAGRCFHMCLDSGGEKPAKPFDIQPFYIPHFQHYFWYHLVI